MDGRRRDELFAGYGRYDWEKRGAWVRRLSPAMRAAVMGMLSMLPETRGPKIAWYALSQSDEAMRLRNWFSLFNSDMQAALLEGSMLAALSRKTPTEMFREHLANCDSSDTLSRMLYVDTKMWLPDDLLARGDKTSMAHSLEARVPLLDHKLVEFAARLPSDLKVRQSERKFILKQTSQRWLPETIVYRKKQGFPLPMTEWLRTELRSFVRDNLSPERLRRRGLFNPAFVERMLNEHDQQVADHSLQIWGLLSVELWQQQFLDQNVWSAAAKYAKAATLV
ncbi:MAG: hypothetical protein HC893_06505 [Chloroflexaceae bacterium]|nr:hypothetical protein [Chloroflexaceae bacterium]